MCCILLTKSMLMEVGGSMPHSQRSPIISILNGINPIHRTDTISLSRFQYLHLGLPKGLLSVGKREENVITIDVHSASRGIWIEIILFYKTNSGWLNVHLPFRVSKVVELWFMTNKSNLVPHLFQHVKSYLSRG